MERERRIKTKECDQKEGGWGPAVKDGGQEVKAEHSGRELSWQWADVATGPPVCS